MNTSLEPWSVRAVNLPEHADNPIHTDEGAREAGFPAAIVAGVSVYAWLTHPPVSAWGEDFLVHGGGELKLVKPVLDQEIVRCEIAGDPTQPVVEAQAGGRTCATFSVWSSCQPPAAKSGKSLPDLEIELSRQWTEYGIRCGDDLALYAELGIAHPVIWPHVANEVFSTHLVSGPWIHTRSRIFHQGTVREGDNLRITSREVARFKSRAGERAVVEMDMSVEDRAVARVEHEAIVNVAL